MSHRIHRLSLACLGAVMCWLAFSPRSSLAQFLFLDTNGDARSSPGDVLNPAGEPTTVNVYLDTSRNADSSVAYCATGSEALSIVSYEFILHAVGGTVTFGNYTNARSTMGVSFGTGSNSTDFYRGFGGGTILSPGLYQLGTLSVTVESGSPTLNPAASTALSPHFGTSFGTQCLATDGDNTYKLGLDWYGIAGCGPPGGGNAAPTMAAPAIVSVSVADPTALAAEFSDPDGPDSLTTTVDGLPPGLVAVRGIDSGGRSQVRAYGILHDTAVTGSTYQLVWRVADGQSAESTRTDLRVVDELSGHDLQERTTQFVTSRYTHGMPRREARGLGAGSLPILLGILGDARYKAHWLNATAGIAFIGDTSYFDTLRAYVWLRFTGAVDRDTYMAIRNAQVSLNVMATLSPRALDYLEATSEPAAWLNVPWTVQGSSREYVSEIMANESVIALGYTDSERARQILLRLLNGQNSDVRTRLIRGALATLDAVRVEGFVRVWLREDNPRPADGGK